MLLWGNVLCMLLLKMFPNKQIDSATRLILLFKPFSIQVSYKFWGLEKVPSCIEFQKTRLLLAIAHLSLFVTSIPLSSTSLNNFTNNLIILYYHINI